METNKNLPNEKFERRSFPENVRLETREENGPPHLIGIGIVFNSWSEDLGGFREMIHPDAVKDIDWNDVVSASNHDPNQILGRSPKTMTIRVLDKGVEYDVTLADTNAGRDVKTSVEREDVKGSSFGFIVAPGGDTWVENEELKLFERTIYKFERVYDLSPVVFPAYKETDASVAKRSLEEFKKSEVPDEKIDIHLKHNEYESDLYKIKKY